MNITIQCFGAFRPFGDALSLSVAHGTTVADLHGLFLKKLKEIDPSFDNPILIDNSRFATETALLASSTPLAEGMQLAVIPPVSGG